MAWRAAGFAPFVIAVNLSPVQFRRGTMENVIRGALDASGLPAAQLELEVTESTLIQDSEKFIIALKGLKSLGIRISIDDFGTGYSSLAYLWRFPFDKVKIDRSFTQGLGSDPKVALIVRSIVTLAHSMEIRVNAEGVETSAQMGALQRYGCDELQGFLLGRPAPANTLHHRGAVQAPPERPAPRPSALQDLVTQPMPL